MPLLPSCKDKEIAYYAHSLISLLIMFGCGQLTPITPLTPLGMNLIGIFLGVLYGWIFIDIIWPSMAGLLALMLIGGMKPNELFQTSFGDPLVMMMFFIFVFCATINYYGLSKFISLWFITRKCVAGKPWLFTYTFFLSIMLLGALTSASPAVVIGWSILYGICDKCGYQKGEGYPTMMVFGIVYAAQIGMSIIPFKQVPFTVLGAYENMSGMTIDYAKYMIIAITCCALCSLLFIVMAKYVFKPDMKKLISLDTEGLDTEGALRLNKVQKIVLGFLFALVVLLLLPNILPATSGIARFFKTIGNTGICMLLVTVMCLLKVDGKPLLRFKTMVDSGVTWGDHPHPRRGDAPFPCHGQRRKRDHQVPHGIDDTLLRKRIFAGIRAVHGLFRYRPHAVHEQRRNGNRPDARRLQLLYRHERSSRACHHHGGHGRPHRVPHSGRQRERLAAARQ